MKRGLPSTAASKSPQLFSGMEFYVLMEMYNSSAKVQLNI